MSDETLAAYENNKKKSPYFRTFEKDGVSYPIPGLVGSTRLIVVDQDTVGANEVTFGFSEFAPASSVHERHTHPDCEEIMYILEGRGVGGVNGIDAVLGKGDVLFVPKGSEHWFFNPFDEACKFLFLYTKGSLKDAGYALQSSSYQEIGEQVEALQNSGNNKFDGQ
ncbi:MAG: cupin domain-containing protein [Clostridia bacterium]